MNRHSSKASRLYGGFLFAVLSLVASGSWATAQTTLGMSDPFLSESPAKGAFPLLADGNVAPIFVDSGDYPGVRRAAADLRDDMKHVSGIQAKLTESSTVHGRAVVIAGTIGKSTLIDGLIRTHKIDVARIQDKWESFLIAVVSNPEPGVDQALVIAGSDKRGTIYGIYECSEEAGVSPWYWWADVPPKHHTSLYARAGVFIQGPPAVKYRGIFINDEDPALSGWAREKFGGVNSRMYAHVFELMLRLRANYLWPAMWGKSFNEDDPASPRLADEYGIVMGTSHHEPMMRAQKEWSTHHKEYGNGQWNYLTNKAGLDRFWTDGVRRNAGYENIYTLGMRGDGDKPMPDAGGFEANKNLLETIIADQRSILRQNVSPDLAQVPQLWAIFTEVQKYYDAGLKVPDDVTLLFTDDNVGNLRRVPTLAESHRSGGAGIYYHMDMNGGPFSYKWLNSNPLPKIWEQMNLAYRYGADRIWIVNVGDIKPLEVPIEFFLRMAWNPDQFNPQNLQTYLQHWAERDFGPAHAAEIADIVAKYAKYNASPKPELVRPDTFSQVHYQEAERVYREWAELAQRAETLRRAIPANEQDAYDELVLHPVLACGNAVQLYIVAGRNHLFAQQGRSSTDSDAALAAALFQRDRELTDHYNKGIAGGKWDHMMDQVHLGYTSWRTPPENLMPPVEKLDLPNSSSFGVAVEGEQAAWPKVPSLTLPTFDSLSPNGHFFDVFPMGTEAVTAKPTASTPWMHLREVPAFSSSAQDRRFWIAIDWKDLPPGTSEGSVDVSGGGEHIVLAVRAVKASPQQAAAASGAFGSLGGAFAFDATQTSTRSEVDGVRWVDLPDYGREDSAVTVMPVTAQPFLPSKPSPSLQYNVFLPASGVYDIDLVTNPTLDIHADSRLAVAISLDDNAPDVEAVFTNETRESETFLGHAFGQNDRANARVMHFHQSVPTAGRHILRISMVDPTLVIEKIIVHRQPLPSSFFGPPAQEPVGHTNEQVYASDISSRR